MTTHDTDALQVLAAHALPEDAPGAWIREAIRLAVEKSDHGAATP